MKKKILLGTALLVVITIPAALGVRFYRSLPSATLAVGETIPTLAAQPVGGASPLPQQGRRALLFFSPSCSYCEEVVAQFGKLRERRPEWFSGDGAVKLALISVGANDETVAFAQNTAWPVYLDADRQVMKAMRGVSVPYLVLVDERNHAQYRHTGMRGLDYHEKLIGAFRQTGRTP